jgi:hypothetical protein
MEKRMTPQEIVKNSNYIKEAKFDWKEAYAALHASIESNKYRIMRKGNTLFWYRIDRPQVAQVFIFNADTYKNLFINLEEFAQAMHKSGYKNVYAETNDFNLINLIRRIGFPVDVEELGKDQSGKQLYRGTVNV